MEVQPYSVEKVSWYRISTRILILICLLLIISLLCTSNQSLGATLTFTPAAPSGPSQGFVEVSYEFCIHTTNPTAFWRFDWGDGTQSTWLQLSEHDQKILQSHSWENVGEYHVYVTYKNEVFPNGIDSDELLVQIKDITQEDYPFPPSSLSGETTGCTSFDYLYETVAVDPKGDYLQYRFDWGDGEISEWTILVRSDTTLGQYHAWESSGTYQIQSQARDQYGLTSSWSDSYEVTIELDSDGDGLADRIEQEAGSNPSNADDVRLSTLGTISHAIIFTDDHVLFYNTEEDQPGIMKLVQGVYLIDIDGNGRYDHSYSLDTGLIEAYSAETESLFSQIFWYLVLAVGIMIGILTLFYLVKTGRIYLYEEYVVEE